MITKRQFEIIFKSNKKLNHKKILLKTLRLSYL